MDNRIQTAEDAAKFAFSGRAVLTVVSERTGVRFTYRIKRSKRGNAFWVELLRGPDNGSDYVFLGTAWEDYEFSHAMKSPVSPKAESEIAALWFFRCLREGSLKRIEVWHQGKCGRCGRALTVPESISTGLGPKCAEMMQ